MDIIQTVKTVAALAEKTRDTELKSAMIALREQINGLREQNLELEEQNKQLEKKLADLSNSIAFKNQLTREHGKINTYIHPDGEKRYVCPKCEANKQYVDCQEQRNNRGYFALTCPACSHNTVLCHGEPIKRTRSRSSWMS